jgi:hypothetical protein
MARKTKAEAGAVAAKSSAKRQTPPPATTSLPKRPKRQSTAKSAPTKSDYFSHGSSEDEDDGHESAVDSLDFESSELDSVSAEDEVESGISEEEEDTSKTSKRSRDAASTKRNSVKTGSKKSGGKAAQSTKSELWRPGVPTGLEPGTQVVIKKPKARDAGETPYTEDTIHPNTLLFLEDLAANNDRGWLKSEYLFAFDLQSDSQPL